MFIKRDTPSPGSVNSDRSKDGVHCDLCGSSNPAVRCDKCSGHAFCLSCDDMYHRHPKRKTHFRKAIDSLGSAHGGGNLRTPSTPGQRSSAPGDPSKMPIPPPRKKKGKSFFSSFGSSNNDIPALPKKEFSITEKLGSIRRFMSNRPLPPVPNDEMKPMGYPPESSPMSERRNMDRATKADSPQYQNILAHLTKVAQNSADEWEEDPSVSTSGSARGSSGGDDIGWGQEFNNAIPKSGGPPVLQGHRSRGGNRSEAIEEWQNGGGGTLRRRQHAQHASRTSGGNISPPNGRMQQSTSMVDLQNSGTNIPPQQPISPSFYPAPYPHFYAPPPGMAPQGYPGAFTNFPAPYYRGSWSNLRSKEAGDDIGHNEDADDDSRFDGGTLTRHKNQSAFQGQMKRSQSVMYDPMMVPNAMFPFGAYPPPGYPQPNQGYFPPYWAPQQQPQPQPPPQSQPQPQQAPPSQQRLATPPSPTSSIRSLNRNTTTISSRERSRKHYQQQRDVDSASSSNISHESPRRRSRGHVKPHGHKQHPERLESSEPEVSSEEEVEDDEDSRNKTETENKKEPTPEEPLEEERQPPAPPAIPTEQWECSFCTFINAAGTRVCTICCKTISVNSPTKTPSESGSARTDDKSTKPEKKSHRRRPKEEAIEFTPDMIKEQEELEKEIRRQIEATIKLRGGSPGERESQISLATETTSNRDEGESSVDAKSSSKAYSPRSTSPAFSSPVPEPELSHSLVSPATPTKSKPSSTSSTHIVDSSEHPADSSRENLSDESKPAESVTDSIRTTRSSNETSINKTASPQKADSSCQTNGEKSLQQPDTVISSSHSIAVGDDNVSGKSPMDSRNSPRAKVEAGTSPPPNNMYSPNSLGVHNMQHSTSNSSLRDEVNFSVKQNQNIGQLDEGRDFFQRGPFLRSLSRASLTSEPGVYSSADPYRGQIDFDQHKRFPGSDWKKRRPSDFTNRTSISKSQILHDTLSSGYNQRNRQEQEYKISMEELIERKRQETMHAHGLEMVRLIRKAEQSGFLPDDLQVALNNCNPEEDPIDWLEENWTNMIETVVTLATNYGHDKPENDVGIISASEAKEALRLHKGNIWASVTECVESRQRKFIELSARGDFTRREIIAALTANNGNMELTYSELTRKTHKPFAMNIWGPGSGVDNLDNKPAFLMPEYNRQPTYLEPFDGSPNSTRRASYLDYRKGQSGDTRNFHRSMLNIHTESEFKPVSAAPTFTPRVERRFSFTSGQIQRPLPYNRYQSGKSNYDVSDTQSILSEDFETMTNSTRGARRDVGRSERGFYGMDKSPKTNIRRSTSFLNKLATIRKDRTKPKKEIGDDDLDYDDYPRDDEEPYEPPRTLNYSRGIEERAMANDNVEIKPQKKSFLNRLMNRSTPPRDASLPKEMIMSQAVIPPEHQESYKGSNKGSKGSHKGSKISLPLGDLAMSQGEHGSNRGSRMSLQLGDFVGDSEVSPIAKVQAFLDIMPEADTTANIIQEVAPREVAPVKEKKSGGFLSRLGLKSTPKPAAASEVVLETPQPIVENLPQEKVDLQTEEAAPTTFTVEDETIFDDQDLTLYQGFVQISDVVPIEEIKDDKNVNKTSSTIQSSPAVINTQIEKPATVEQGLKSQNVLQKGIGKTSPTIQSPPAVINTQNEKQASVEQDVKTQNVLQNVAGKTEPLMPQLSTKQEETTSETLNQINTQPMETPTHVYNTEGVSQSPNTISETTDNITGKVTADLSSNTTEINANKTSTNANTKSELNETKLITAEADTIKTDNTELQKTASLATDIAQTAVVKITNVPKTEANKAAIAKSEKPKKLKKQTGQDDLATSAKTEPEKEPIIPETKVLPVAAKVTDEKQSEILPQAATIQKTETAALTTTTRRRTRGVPTPPMSPRAMSPEVEPITRRRTRGVSTPPLSPRALSPEVQQPRVRRTRGVPTPPMSPREMSPDLEPSVSRGVRGLISPVFSKPFSPELEPPRTRRIRGMPTPPMSPRALSLEPDLEPMVSRGVRGGVATPIMSPRALSPEIEPPRTRRIRGMPTPPMSPRALSPELEPMVSRGVRGGATTPLMSPRALSPEVAPPITRRIRGVPTPPMSPRALSPDNLASVETKVTSQISKVESSANQATIETALNRPSSPRPLSPKPIQETTTSLDTAKAETSQAEAPKTDEPRLRRQRPKPIETEEPESPKNLPTTALRRRRSLSTEKSNPIRVRQTSMVIAADVEAALEMELEKELDGLPADEESKVSSTPDTSKATTRVRKRSVSRDRNASIKAMALAEPTTIKPAKEAIAAASAGAGAKFHYLKAVTAESLRPKGTFATKRQLSKDGSTPPAEVTPKPVTKAPVVTKKLFDGPAVSSRRIALDKKIKELQAAGKCSNYEQAEMAARLMEMNFDEKESLEAAKECGSLYQAISFLQQDCELCAGKFHVAEMVSMVNCTHRACKGCLKAYFTIQIRDRNIMELLCPFCNEPDLSDDDIASDYFNNMDLLLKNLVDIDSHELFHRKLRDRALMKDPLFRWCSQCSSGFIITNPNQKRLLCPDCKAVTCAQCRKRWEKQHEGISCEQFLAWKEANDPEIQAAGLAQHLAENGIDCPNCNFRYSLAKGGCMHFRCVQCQFDFCSGCGKSFKMGNKCGVSEFCEKLGLHAHHPRNCLFYLRDKEPTELQKILDEHNVVYNQNPPEGSEVKMLCQVNEQKETADGLKDDICGKYVMEGFAGLCRVHYLEYLGGLITKNNIDPVNIFSNDELELVLKRAALRLPPKFYGQREIDYRKLLLEVINEKLPLGTIEGEKS